MQKTLGCTIHVLRASALQTPIETVSQGEGRQIESRYWKSVPLCE